MIVVYITSSVCLSSAIHALRMFSLKEQMLSYHYYSHISHAVCIYLRTIHLSDHSNALSSYMQHAYVRVCVCHACRGIKCP